MILTVIQFDKQFKQICIRYVANQLQIQIPIQTSDIPN